MKSEALTVSAYLASLPADRREAISAMRDLVNRNLPKGYREAIGYGMITWSVPLEIYPDTYNGQPLMYAALASQKQYMAIYLMNVYGESESARAFRDAFAKAGKKLDMGKCCVRFRRPEALHLPAIARVIAACGMKDYIARARAVNSPDARAARKAARAKPAKSQTGAGSARKKAAARPARKKAGRPA